MRERIHRSIRILALLLAMALTAAGCAGVEQPATETDAVVPTAMEEAEKLTVEVQDASASGNTAEFRLKVTANELDTVLYDNGMAHLKNYRFGDETAIFSRMTFGEQPCLISHRYFYADEDESLAPNQFLLWVRILCRDDIDTELFTIPLTDFGFFDSATGMLVPLYKGVWQVKVPLNLTADPPRRLDLGSRLAFEGQELTIESIELTPLACTVVLHCGEYADLPPLMDESRNASLTLSDGTRWSSDQFSVEGSWRGSENVIWLDFFDPASVSEIRTLTLFGEELSLAP